MSATERGAPLELDAGNVASYAAAQGFVPAGAAPEVEALGGGISNQVLRVGWPGGCVVVKQSLPRLRVATEWRFDRSRVVLERDCMAYLGALLREPGVPLPVPTVVHADGENYVFAMSCAPCGGTLWKEQLLRGHVDLAVARRAGALLARIHRLAAADDAARERFWDQTVLVQGRVDPYHLTTAEAHPDLAPLIRAEVERLLSERRTLVLGDYCPKNTIVYSDRLLVLDFEVAHWGDPAFDVAFCLNHLLLKACHFPGEAEHYIAGAQAVWSAYESGIEADGGRTEAATVRELGCLLLARIDGKSPVEYITDSATKDLVRRLAADLLRGNEQRLPPVFEMALGRIRGFVNRRPAS